MKLFASAVIAANGVFAGRYQGKSLKNRGIATMTLDEETSKLWNNGAMSTTIGRILNSPFDEIFPLDFIQPHNGPQFIPGETIKFLYNLNFSDRLYSMKKFSFDIESYNGNSTRFLEDQLGAENVHFDQNLDALLYDSFDGVRASRLGGSRNFNVYHDLSSIEAWLLGDVNAHEHATVSSIGKTHENRDIWVVNISNPPSNLSPDSSLPTIVVDCGIHAREWVSPAFCQHFINELLDSSGIAQSWKNTVNWVIYPLLNPDGYAFSWSGDRMWRKNRRVNSGSSCVGVDLNRNYNAKWNTFGSSSNPCHQTYHGVSAFSEPESSAHRNHMATIENKQAYLTFHSFSEVIIYPYSTIHSDEADNRAELNSLAGEMVAGIKSVHGKTYRKGEGAEIFGLAAGGSDDWAHMSGIPISYTIELRDTGSFGFLLPESQIQPTCEENMKGVEAVFDHIKPLNTCSSCSGNCWFHKNTRLFKCFAPTEDEEDEIDDSSEGDDPIEPELDCRCNSKPKNCSSCNSKCLAINGRRVSMEFTCPETGFTQTFTNQKCNKIRKMNMSENCGTLSCACAAELTVAETGKGTKFECTVAKKKPTYRVYCDANNDNRFNLGETNQERKVKCKRGAIKRNPFNLQC